MFDVPPSDMQRLGSRPIERNFDQLGGLIGRLAPIVRKLSSESGPLCFVDQPAPYLVARGDMWISDQPAPLLVEIGRGGIGRRRLVADGARIDCDHAPVRLQGGKV